MAALAVTALACGASAEPIASARLAQIAKMEDWSGVWRVSASGPLSGPAGKRETPPYNAAWQAKYAANLADSKLTDTSPYHCLDGMPRNIANGNDRAFMITPEMTMILVGGEMRLIYTDGRKLPPDDEVWPKFQGWSIGQWQGRALNIETHALKSTLWAAPTPVLFSEKATVKEQLRLVDKNTIENRVTITDPVSLTSPWTFTHRYVRQDGKLWTEEKHICGPPITVSPLPASTP